MLLKFTESESVNKLSWKHEKEFEYQNEMYDVVCEQQQGDTIYYWCWWDYEETLLNKKLTKLVAVALGNDSENRENNTTLLRLWKLLYFETNEFDNQFFTESACLVDNFLFVCLTPSFSPPAPPPKLII